MPSIPMFVAVYEDPEDPEESLRRKKTAEEDLAHGCPWDADARHALGLKSGEFELLVRGLDARTIRDATHRVLRRFEQGESMIRRENDLHFVWTHGAEGELFLFVLPEELLIELSLRLMGRAPAMLN